METCSMTPYLNPSAMFRTPWLLSAVIAWTLAQTIKMAGGYHRTRKLDFRYLVSTGGMPSAHSAMVCALTAAIGMTEGFNEPVTLLAVFFSAVTMFDASTVRRATGQQAQLLNEIVAELFHEHRLSENKLKELLGHTRLEVFMGMCVGILSAINVVLRMK